MFSTWKSNFDNFWKEEEVRLNKIERKMQTDFEAFLNSKDTTYKQVIVEKNKLSTLEAKLNAAKKKDCSKLFKILIEYLELVWNDKITEKNTTAYNILSKYQYKFYCEANHYFHNKNYTINKTQTFNSYISIEEVINKFKEFKTIFKEIFNEIKNGNSKKLLKELKSKEISEESFKDYFSYLRKSEKRKLQFQKTENIEKELEKMKFTPTNELKLSSTENILENKINESEITKQ